jgi:ABC-type multidrug transport system fused ATPase/permease subunit
LFEGSIRTNLLYANPVVNEDQMWEALRIPGLAATVAALPAGLDAPVGERGDWLSGSQRQRLALARVIVAQPTVLLDGCTSILDSETEYRIQLAPEQGLPGRTCVIISHKVASVRRADRIIVLEFGTIVQQGTHAELLARAELYAETDRRQTAALATLGTYGPDHMIRPTNHEAYVRKTRHSLVGDRESEAGKHEIQECYEKCCKSALIKLLII